MLTQHYHELMRKIKGHEEKKISWLMIICQINYQSKLEKTMGIEKFDNTKILIHTNGKLPDYITLKSFVILLT